MVNEESQERKDYARYYELKNRIACNWLIILTSVSFICASSAKAGILKTKEAKKEKVSNIYIAGFFNFPPLFLFFDINIK